MQIGGRLRAGDPWLRSSNEPETPAGALMQTVEALNLLLVHHRHPQSGGEEYFCPTEVWGGNAENGEGMFVQLNRPPYHRRIAAEMTAPICIAEHDVRTTVGPVLIRCVKEAAKIRPEAQRIEVVSTGFIDPYLGWVAVCVQSGGREVEREDAIEAPVPVAHILVVRIGVQGLSPGFDGVEAFRVWHIDRVQNQGI